MFIHRNPGSAANSTAGSHTTKATLTGLSLAVLALSATTLTATPSSAHADPALTGLQRCQQGASPDYAQDITYQGGQIGGSFPDGNDPYNAILPGDTVRVTSTGTISYDLWGNRVGPNGNDVHAPASFPFPGLNEYSSVANWNNRGSGWVGHPMQTTWLDSCTAAPTVPVRLLYYINDPTRWDNGGQWTIHTELFRGP